MICSVALYQVLRCFPRSVNCVALELDGPVDLLSNDSAHAASLGVPAHMVTDPEFSDRHRVSPGHRLSHVYWGMAWLCRTCKHPGKASTARLSRSTLRSGAPRF